MKFFLPKFVLSVFGQLLLLKEKSLSKSASLLVNIQVLSLFKCKPCLQKNSVITDEVEAISFGPVTQKMVDLFNDSCEFELLFNKY